MEQKKNDLKKIGALWNKTGASGVEYWTGKLDSGESIMIFKAREKKHAKSPDYNIMMRVTEVVAPVQGDMSEPKLDPNADSDLPF